MIEGKQEQKKNNTIYLYIAIVLLMVSNFFMLNRLENVEEENKLQHEIIMILGKKVFELDRKNNYISTEFLL